MKIAPLLDAGASMSVISKSEAEELGFNIRPSPTAPVFSSPIANVAMRAIGQTTLRIDYAGWKEDFVVWVVPHLDDAPLILGYKWYGRGNRSELDHEKLVVRFTFSSNAVPFSSYSATVSRAPRPNLPSTSRQSRVPSSAPHSVSVPAPFPLPVPVSASNPVSIIASITSIFEEDFAGIVASIDEDTTQEVLRFKFCKGVEPPPVAAQHEELIHQISALSALPVPVDSSPPWGSPNLSHTWPAGSGLDVKG